jgi:hypothetical protein
MTAAWIELTAAIVRGTPKLSGALCRQWPELFDGDDEETADRAAAICQRCPALQACGEWAGGLRHNQRNGVIAGQFQPWVSHPSELRKRINTNPKGTNDDEHAAADS